MSDPEHSSASVSSHEIRAEIYSLKQFFVLFLLSRFKMKDHLLRFQIPVKFWIHWTLEQDIIGSRYYDFKSFY